MSLQACCQQVNEELLKERQFNQLLEQENTCMKRERVKWLALQEESQDIKQRLAFVETKCEQLEQYNQRLADELLHTAATLKTFQGLFNSLESQLSQFQPQTVPDFRAVPKQFSSLDESFQVKGVDFGLMGATHEFSKTNCVQKRNSTPKKAKPLSTTSRKTPQKSSRTPSRSKFS